MTLVPGGCASLADVTAQLSGMISYSVDGIKLFSKSLAQSSLSYIATIVRAGRASQADKTSYSNVMSGMNAVLSTSNQIIKTNYGAINLTKGSLRLLLGVIGAFCDAQTEQPATDAPTEVLTTATEAPTEGLRFN